MISSGKNERKERAPTMTNTTFDHQQMTSEMGKARYLWTTFARRAQSALALAAAAQAFGALAREMDAYDTYQLLEQQPQQQLEEQEKLLDIRAYEEVLLMLGRACENWWRAATTLQASSEETLPAAFAQREALITACLEQRLRLVAVSTHLLKLQLTVQEQRERATQAHESGERGKEP
jgi:hypothetical protein